jgi:hypothetical protein
MLARREVEDRIGIGVRAPVCRGRPSLYHRPQCWHLGWPCGVVALAFALAFVTGALAWATVITGIAVC